MPILPVFRSEDFFRSKGGLFSSLFLRELLGDSSTPTGLTAHRDPSSSSSGKSNAGASSNEIFALSWNRSESVPPGVGSGFCSGGFTAGLGFIAEYGLIDDCHSVGGESWIVGFRKFVLTVRPSLEAGVPGDGVLLGITVIGSRFELFDGVTMVGATKGINPPANDDLPTRSATTLGVYCRGAFWIDLAS